MTPKALKDLVLNNSPASPHLLLPPCAPSDDRFCSSSTWSLFPLDGPYTFYSLCQKCSFLISARRLSLILYIRDQRAGPNYLHDRALLNHRASHHTIFFIPSTYHRELSYLFVYLFIVHLSYWKTKSVKMGISSVLFTSKMGHVIDSVLNQYLLNS